MKKIATELFIQYISKFIVTHTNHNSYLLNRTEAVIVKFKCLMMLNYLIISMVVAAVKTF